MKEKSKIVSNQFDFKELDIKEKYLVSISILFLMIYFIEIEILKNFY